jgi:hypothetical protein
MMGDHASYPFEGKPALPATRGDKQADKSPWRFVN